MPKKRKSTASTAKSEKLWIQQTLKRLRALQETRGPEPPAAAKAAPKPAAKPAPKAAKAPRRASHRKKK